MFPESGTQNTNSSRQVVWLIASDPDAPSLREVRNAVSAEETDIVLVRSVSEALDDVRLAALPDVVVVCQSCPDEWSRRDVETLIGALPLTRWLVVFGPWCESIGRTESIWPDAWTVPLRLAPPRISEAVGAGTLHQPPVPPTFSRDDVFARDAAAATELTGRAAAKSWSRSASVETDDREFGWLMSELLRECRIEIVSPEQAELLLITASIPNAELLGRVRAHRDAYPRRAVVVVSDLATSHDAHALRRAGADAVISQLRAREELARYLLSRSA